MPDSNQVEPLSMELDMENRDPKPINDFLQADWPDVFGEPTGIRSFDCVWQNSYKVYIGTKFWCYRICSAIFGIPCAFCWGLYFACISFYYIWYATPCVKAFMIQIGFAGKIWAVYIKTFCDPLFESCALVLSRINISSGGGGGGGDSKA
ncbi:caveolin-1-like [Amphiura filiformis]|uniref:caveolin-1-like n=1 Tax=Amphiura filiformis TaxID=82378 RepID=UPI003B2238D2